MQHLPTLTAAISVGLTLFAASCNSCYDHLICMADPLYVETMNYPNADSARVLRFKADGAFDNPVDTAAITLSAIGNTADTQVLNYNFAAGNDYMVVLLPANDTFRLTKLANGSHLTEDEPYPCGKGPASSACDNPITAWSLNKVMSAGWVCYLKK